MTLESFTTIAKEIGIAISNQMRPLTFLFFGASSDPSMIQDFASYLTVWLDSLPAWQQVKLYSHGWNLEDIQEKNELTLLLNVLRAQPDRLKTFGLSVDLFSQKAREDFPSYIHNVSNNLNALYKELCLTKLKIQVTYPIERYYLESSPTTIEYWKEVYQKYGSLPEIDSMLKQIYQSATENSQKTSKLTGAVIKAGLSAGLTKEELITIVRDNKIPFSSGRGKKLYTQNTGADLASYAAKEQKDHALRVLKDNEFDYKGVVIYPNGRTRLLDCRLYELGPWLNNGDPVLPYAETLAAR
ncbi:hypothetical protein [Maridesulfovibrio sp.]|uniref:hypothetical protein n=1 Tax=Maridesulfovibrio sp. TaxID=2795000 RepID=UPI0039F0EE39